MISAHAFSRVARLQSSLVVAAIVSITLIHRGLLWSRFGDLMDASAQVNSDWLTWQYLLLPAYREHFLSSLWYLQQTPPLSHLAMGALVKLASWPVGVAHGLYALQAVTSACTASCLYLILLRLGCRVYLSAFVALYFALSSDLYLMEMNSFGQLLYESAAMLFCTAACLSLIVGSERAAAKPVPGSVWRWALPGILVALAALTRSSFSYFFVPIAVFVALAQGARSAAVFLLPVLIMQGGWCLKNYSVYGGLSCATSSWAGLNATNGLSAIAGGREEFVAMIVQSEGAYSPWFVRLLRERGYVGWHPPVASDYIPRRAQARERAIQARLGGTNRPENLLGTKLLSDQYMKAFRDFAPRHIPLLARKFAIAYTVYWKPIANYSAALMGSLYVLPRDRSSITQLVPAAPEQAMATTGKFPSRESVAVELPAVSLYMLDTVCLWTIHLIFPFTLFVDWVLLLIRRRPILNANLLLLAVVAGYGAVLFNAVEIGENMRFRLSVEPANIALSIGVLSAWVAAVRRHFAERGLRSQRASGSA